MVPEVNQGENCLKDREIHGESNVWSSAER